MLLNKLAHISDPASSSSIHALFAQELTKFANSCGVPTTYAESSLSHHNAGADNTTSKHADMINLTGCGFTVKEIFQKMLVYMLQISQ